MEPEDSLLLSQVPTPVHILSQIHPGNDLYRVTWRFILILSSHVRLGLSTVSFPQISSPQLCIHLYSPHTCFVHRLSHYSRFNHPNNIWLAVRIIKLFSIYFFPCPYSLISLRSKYSSQHPVLKHPQPRSALNVSDNKSYNLFNCLVSASCFLCTTFPVFCGRPFYLDRFFFYKSVLFELSLFKKMLCLHPSSCRHCFTNMYCKVGLCLWNCISFIC